MRHDLFNNINPKRGYSPQAATTDNTPIVSEIVSTKGAGSGTWLIITGDLGDAGATFTALLEHDDDVGFGTAVAVPDEQLLGTEALASFTQADDNKVFKLGYAGSKEFTRLTITPAGNATAAYIVLVYVQGDLQIAPAPNPPA